MIFSLKGNIAGASPPKTERCRHPPFALGYIPELTSMRDVLRVMYASKTSKQVGNMAKSTLAYIHTDPSFSTYNLIRKKLPP